MAALTTTKTTILPETKAAQTGESKTDSTLPSPQATSALQGRKVQRRDNNPLRQLTVDLIKSYKDINKKYYAARAARQAAAGQEVATRKRRRPPSYSTEETSESRAIQLIMQKKFCTPPIKIGEGSTGFVFSTTLTGNPPFKKEQKGHPVAVKVSRVSKNALQFEAQVLHHLHRAPLCQRFPTLKASLLQTHGSFPLSDKVHCLVFEKLSENLFQLIQRTQYQGVSLRLTAIFPRQILQHLAPLHEQKYVHCDIKPENVLLKSPKLANIKLVDFGCAQREGYSNPEQYHSSRFYRPPEICLGQPITSKIDIWSLATTIFEIHTGRVLFDVKDNLELYHAITSLLGNPPAEFIEASRVRAMARFFTKNSEGQYVPKGQCEKFAEGKLRKCFDALLEEKAKKEPETASLLKDLLTRCLKWNPKERPSVIELLHHPFIKTTTQQQDAAAAIATDAAAATDASVDASADVSADATSVVDAHSHQTKIGL